MSDPTLIDTHCHLTFPPLHDTVGEVLERATQAHVSSVISVGTDLDDSQRCIDLAGRYAQVFCTVGIHPHEAASATPHATRALADLADHPRVVAIGETGLDYHYDFSPPKTQQAIFHEQLALAEQARLPIVIHCREAFDDALAILAEHPCVPGAVFHCFTGGPEEARKVLDFGAWISFTGVVTFKNAREVAEAAKIVPADRIMVETDAPFLTPEPMRKIHPNEPRYVVHTARFLAELRRADPTELEQQLDANAERFFGIRLPRLS